MLSVSIPTLVLAALGLYWGCVCFAHGFGPGPITLSPARLLRFWPLRPPIKPLRRWDRRLARKVTYALSDLAPLTWSQQRYVYWRVRRFPDARYARSPWTAGIVGSVILLTLGAFIWGCGLWLFWGLRQPLSQLSTAVSSSWIPYGFIAIWVLCGKVPLVVGLLASVAQCREDAGEAIRRYVSSSLTACDRCGYAIDPGLIMARTLRCPECGLRHHTNVRGFGRASGRWRVQPAEDGPALISPKRAARICRGVPGYESKSPEVCARILDYGIWFERAGLVFGRLFYGLFGLLVAFAIDFALWAYIVGVLGRPGASDALARNVVSMAIALVGPAVGVALWLWLDRRMLRGMARRAASRRALTCPECLYSLEGLTPSARGLYACPECGRESFPRHGASRVLEVAEVESQWPRAEASPMETASPRGGKQDDGSARHGEPER